MPDFIKSFIRNIPDFPKPGIQFKDITPLLSDQHAFRRTIDLLESRYCLQTLDRIVGIDARGFIFGAALADRLHLGFVPVRKEGKLPADTHDHCYALEYGEAVLEIHADALKEGDQVVVVDDLIATGGTAAATCALVEKLGAKVVECAFVVELEGLKGREKLGDREVFSLVGFG